MKKFIVAVSCYTGLAMLGIPEVHSQVIFYGQVDAALHYAKNGDGHGNSVLELQGGGLYANKIGFKGTEDLGNGMKTIFQLESGFASDTGSFGSQSYGKTTQLFGRQSYIGLQGDFGTVSAGRQYNALTVAFDFQEIGDQFFIGGDNFFSGYRLSNSIIYKKKLGPVSIQLDYGLGEQADGISKKASIGGNIAYSNGPLKLAAAYLQNRSADGSTTGKYANLNTAYAFTDASHAHIGYLRGQESGASRRKRHMLYVGLDHHLTPAWKLYGAYFYYWQSDCNGVCIHTPGSPNNVSGGLDTSSATGYGTTAGKGKATVITLISSYDLSRYTTLYAETDMLIARDGAARDHLHYVTQQDKQGTGSMRQMNFMLGMRHAF